MRIGLDVFPLVVYKNKGIGNYTKNFYKALFKIDTDNSYILLNWSNESVMYEFGNNNNVSEYFAVCEHEENNSAIEMIINSFISRECIDVFYTTMTLTNKYHMYRREWFGNTKLVMTVHDITPLILKNIFINNNEELETYKSNCLILQDYDLLFANSENTKIDIENHLGLRNIFNISMDMDKKEYVDIEVEKAWEDFSCCGNLKPENYFLFIGGSQVNKNLNRILRAFLHLSNKVKKIPKLVIAGHITLQCNDDLFYFIKKYGLDDKVILVESPTDVELVALYRNAFWMVFPSMYEGFGMPVLEAWQQGCPVLTSNNSSLKEIAEGFSVQVDPFSVESIENGLLKVLSLNDDERLQFIIKGKERLKSFSWEKTAREALRLIGERM